VTLKTYAKLLFLNRVHKCIKVKLLYIQCINCNLIVIGIRVNILHVKIKSHEGHVCLLTEILARVFHIGTMIRSSIGHVPMPHSDV
jgi:hypothetical protein